MAQSGKRGNPLACRTRLEPKPLLSWGGGKKRDCHSIADEVTVFLCLTGRGGWGQPRPRGRGSRCDTRWLTRAPYADVPQPAPLSLSGPQTARLLSFSTRRCPDVPGGPYAEAYAGDSTQALSALPYSRVILGCQNLSTHAYDHASCPCQTHACFALLEAGAGKETGQPLSRSIVLTHSRVHRYVGAFPFWSRDRTLVLVVCPGVLRTCARSEYPRSRKMISAKA